MAEVVLGTIVSPFVFEMAAYGKSPLPSVTGESRILALAHEHEKRIQLRALAEVYHTLD